MNKEKLRIQLLKMCTKDEIINLSLAKRLFKWVETGVDEDISFEAKKGLKAQFKKKYGK